MTDIEAIPHPLVPLEITLFTDPGAIANVAPELIRRPKPTTVEALLAWAGEPLATAEVAAVAQLDVDRARATLDEVARPSPAGADVYWALPRY